jgi:hypothetical protein
MDRMKKEYDGSNLKEFSYPDHPAILLFLSSHINRG